MPLASPMTCQYADICSQTYISIRLHAVLATQTAYAAANSPVVVQGLASQGYTGMGGAGGPLPAHMRMKGMADITIKKSKELKKYMDVMLKLNSYMEQASSEYRSRNPATGEISGGLYQSRFGHGMCGEGSLLHDLWGCR